MRYLKPYKLFESAFVSEEEVDELLDKISKYNITSLSDVEKNRLVLFSERDKEIIDTIEKMADITNNFKKINAEMRRCQDSGESDGFHLMEDWLKLNNELRPLEASFKKWGIELGDYRLSSLMKKQRPDAYGAVLESRNFGYKILETIPYNDIENIIDTIAPIGRRKSRFRTTYELSKKSKICSICKDKEVSFAKLGVDKGGGRHWDLYAGDGTAFNIDHIHPKSKGGKNHISNYQLTCITCNSEKSNNLPVLENIDLDKVKLEIEDILQYITDDRYIVKIYPKDKPRKDSKIIIDVTTSNEVGVITNTMKESLLHLSRYMYENGYNTKSLVNMNNKSYGWSHNDKLEIGVEFTRLIILMTPIIIGIDHKFYIPE